MATVAFDTETYLLNKVPPEDPKTCTLQVPKMVCMSWTDGDKIVIERPRAACHRFQDWLEDDVVLVGHNVAFDLAVMVRACWEHLDHNVLQAVYDKVFRDVRCTYVRQKLIDIATTGLYFRKGLSGYSLADLAKYHLDFDYGSMKGGDSWRMRYNELAPWPTESWPEEARKYAKLDARMTYRVYQQQCEKKRTARGAPLSGSSAVVNERFQVASAFAIQLIQAWGLGTDEEQIEKFGKKYRRRLGELEKELARDGLYEGGRIRQDKKRAVFRRAWEQTDVPSEEWERTDKTNKISTSGTARDRLKRHGVELDIFERLQEYQRLEKYIASYIEPLEAAAPKACCPRYDPLKETGRTGAASPNIQNFPKRNWGREVRRCFKPRPGMIFVTADWSTIELVCLSQICLNLGFESEMAKAIWNGRDLHLDFAASLRGISYEKAGRLYEEGDGDIADARTAAKMANYGLPGGLSTDSLVMYAMGFGEMLTYEQAEHLRTSWFRKWPETSQYFDWIQKHRTPGGSYPIRQHAPSGNEGVWRDRHCFSFSQAANTMFQGMAADLAKFTLCELVRRCYLDESSALYGSRMCAFVHDEVVLEAPESKAFEAAEQLHAVMCHQAKIMLPDLPVQADVQIGDRWGKGDELELKRVE